jgi:hypothetical protein
MRFELGLVHRRPKQPPPLETETCYTPQDGNDIVSTNHAPQ